MHNSSQRLPLKHRAARWGSPGALNGWGAGRKKKCKEELGSLSPRASPPGPPGPPSRLTAQPPATCPKPMPLLFTPWEKLCIVNPEKCPVTRRRLISRQLFRQLRSVGVSVLKASPKFPQVMQILIRKLSLLWARPCSALCKRALPATLSFIQVIRSQWRGVGCVTRAQTMGW